MNIRITIGDLEIPAELNETATKKKFSLFPSLQTSFDTSGNRDFFTIPVQARIEAAPRRG